MERVILKPAKKDRKIPDPKSGQFLPEEGMKVKMSKYWRRLLMSEQVVIVKEGEKKSKTSRKKKKKILDENIELNEEKIKEGE